MNRRTEMPNRPAPAGTAAIEPGQSADLRPGIHAAVPSAERATEPCLHCGHPVPVRLMGCKGGHCPNCRHPYPHGDCSD